MNATKPTHTKPLTEHLPNIRTPSSIAEVQATVTEIGSTGSRIFPSGGRTKPALSTLPSTWFDTVTMLDMTALSGILEYQPNEYTFTALAGTPIAMVEEALAAQGQYLPFEPPFDRGGATLGGTVAAGVSGAGRYRYGGVRDFLIGIRFVDGKGDLVMGGGKVVKNAAGFDLPKLMVGSIGRLGVLVELSFKVFPTPVTYRTLQLDYESLADALIGLSKLGVAPMDIDAVDLVPNRAGSGVQMLVRIGGLESVLYARLGRLEDLLMDGTIVDLTQEAQLWNDLRNFSWATDGVDDDASSYAIVKIPISPERILDLDAEFANHTARCVYSVGGHLCWLAWGDSLAELDQILHSQSLTGLLLRSSQAGAGVADIENSPYLGVRNGIAFAQRIQQGIDPEGRFLPVG